MGLCGKSASKRSFAIILFPLKVWEDKSGSVKTLFGEQLERWSVIRQKDMYKNAFFNDTVDGTQMSPQWN